MIVVDLERYNDGEGGLVGPFATRAAAEKYIAAQESEFVRKWARIRPVTPADADYNFERSPDGLGDDWPISGGPRLGLSGR